MSEMPEAFASRMPALKDGEPMVVVEREPEMVSAPPKSPLPPTLRPEFTSTFWLNCAKLLTWSVSILLEPTCSLEMVAPPMSITSRALELNDATYA